MADSNVNRDIQISQTKPRTPAFIKAEDIDKHISGYDLCKIITGQLGNQLDTLQPVKNLWRVYMKNDQAKIDLVTQGLGVMGKSVKVYHSNPYIYKHMDDRGEQVRLIKVLIKDLYLSVANSEVEFMLIDKFGLKLASEVKFACYRDDQTDLTGWGNGDRYVLVHPSELTVPLPREASTTSFKCRIFHYGQMKGKRECYNCFSTEHYGRGCKRPKCCRICKSPGHEPGDRNCPYWVEKIEGILPFGGYKDPFSNHYPCTFYWNGIKLKSSEHGFLYKKAMLNGQRDLALEILKARHATAAKDLSKQIRCMPDWDNSKIALNIMKEINFEKYEQVQVCQDALHKAFLENLELVEAVPSNDVFWSSSLSKEQVVHVRRDRWPGANRMGGILNELMEDKWGEAMPEHSLNDIDSSFVGMDSIEREQHRLKMDSMDTPVGVPENDDKEEDEKTEEGGEELTNETKDEEKEDGEIDESSHKTTDEKPLPMDFLSVSKDSIKEPDRSSRSKVKPYRGRAKAAIAGKPIRQSSPRSHSQKRNRESPLANESKKLEKSPQVSTEKKLIAEAKFNPAMVIK